ncbi:gamma-glutamyl-gamma-aminobutyrate hydrolase family protein [Secundilactobacillus muriivasis]
MKPLIGMPTDADWTHRGFKDYIDDRVAQGIVAAGGIPVMIPPHDVNMIDDYVARCDGFAFLGGPDIDPTLFGEEPVAKLGNTSLRKDQFELGLCRAAFKAGKAMFGICRGIQIIGIALGGQMYQDFPSQHEGAFVKHQQDAPAMYPTHHVTTVPGTLTAKLLGEKPYVNSFHHQTLKTDVGPLLKVTAQAADGAVEAIESVDNQLVLAVQWHPEFLFETMPEERALWGNFVQRVEQGG